MLRSSYSGAGLTALKWQKSNGSSDKFGAYAVSAINSSQALWENGSRANSNSRPSGRRHTYMRHCYAQIVWPWTKWGPLEKVWRALTAPCNGKQHIQGEKNDDAPVGRVETLRGYFHINRDVNLRFQKRRARGSKFFHYNLKKPTKSNQWLQ